MFILPYTSHQSTWLAGNNIVSGKSQDDETAERSTK